MEALDARVAELDARLAARGDEAPGAS
jgi:hypothetical protein